MGEDIDEGGCEVDEGGYEGGGGAQPPVDWSLDRYHRYNVCVYCAKDHQPLFVCDTVQPAEHGGKRYTCPMVFHSECLHALDVAVPADDKGVEWNCPLCSGMAALPDDAALSIHLKTGVKTAAHDCGAVEYCKWGCGAYTWPSEAGKCCHNGAHILTEEFNPPMHPEYRALIASLGLGKVCVNSRFLNGHLAFGTVCHVPNKSSGGLGFQSFRGPSFIKLHGMIYSTLPEFQGGRGGQFHTHMLPDAVFLDGAQTTCGTSTSSRTRRGKSKVLYARARVRVRPFL